MNNENFKVVVLAGGDSKRMFQNKANMIYKNKTFFENIYDEISKEYKVILSHNSYEKYKNYNVEKIEDLLEGVGPLGGIYSSLKLLNSDNIFFIPCDTPNIKVEFLDYLSNYINKDVDAIVPVDRLGKKFPTVAIYNKKILPKIEEAIANKNYKLISLLNNINTKYVKLEYTIFNDEILSNINTKKYY